MEIDETRNPKDMYDSEDADVLRSRIVPPYRVSVYGTDTMWRVEKRLDGQPIPASLQGLFTSYQDIETAVRVALSNEAAHSKE